jgi:anti-sigma-K factor RskA
MTRIALWLFVIALGIDLGAGVYEARIVVPLWAAGIPDTLASGNPYARVAIDAGVRFWAYMTSAVAVLAVVALIAAFQTLPPRRTWQIVAAVAELAAVASTLLYFRPTLVRLFLGHGAGLSQAQIVSTVDRWVLLSKVRIGISFVAWCAALRALSLS